MTVRPSPQYWWMLSLKIFEHGTLQANNKRFYLIQLVAVYSPSKQAMDQMAKDLVGKYPALGDPRRKHLGYQMWFMGSSDGSPASGFLEERLKNQRKKISDKKLLSTSATKCNELDLPVLNWISDDEDGEIF